LSDQDLWVDVRLLAAAPTDPSALQVFRPALLEDLEGLDPVFDGWLLEQRQQVTQIARSTIEAMLAAETGMEQRIAAAERLLTIDPTHEGAWQTLIRSHLQQGDHAAARSALEQCTISLSSTGLAPSPETEQLLRSTWPTPTGKRSHTRSNAVRLSVLPLRALDRSGVDTLLPGLVEEITAAISRFRWISCSVVPRHELASDYLLDSTLQSSGDSLRVIVRLLDLQSGNDVIWARRFDSKVGDALQLQSELAAEISAQIDPELLLRESEHRTHLDRNEATAFDLTLQAIPAIYRLEHSAFHSAGKLLASAAAMEPGSAAAHAWWAYWHLFLLGQAWAEDPTSAMRRADELAERAVTLDPGDARALALVGHVRAFLHRRAEEACILHERALSLNPNLPLAWCLSGLAHCYLGRHDTAVEHILHARHLSPHDPHAFFVDMALMMPYYLKGELAQALAAGRRAIELNPAFTSTYKGYLATLGRLGSDQEARRIRARLLRLEPRFSVKSAIERSPMTQRADLDAYAEGLRQAGLTEG
jgi:tetratricopeptide (TPR) repeat protein